eukprot:CAMPEP_0202961946 /NCGR_PEP_ID=MMETSP1396-20130829/6042_1 /ASSEMBLY_ACC=CAM_ASM_000872 /TAXON_ID= /ORGANISM="Pseudokeronopsis sp., Strain Brazil" /LENGTH=135 /DNA_ID=CAMNT_0049682181 /DNA_START=27 /DNA_END=434 /DNA_ORIENTATION=+
MVSNSVKVFACALLIASCSGYASSWFEAVDCIACCASGSTYTWWEEKNGYTCTDSVWDESICPLYSTCTFQTTTCMVATSQYMCADASQTLTSTACDDWLVTDLEGRYVVVQLPPATYCTMSLSNLYHGNSANEI